MTKRATWSAGYLARLKVARSCLHLKMGITDDFIAEHKEKRHERILATNHRKKEYSVCSNDFSLPTFLPFLFRYSRIVRLQTSNAICGSKTFGKRFSDFTRGKNGAFFFHAMLVDRCS